MKKFSSSLLREKFIIQDLQTGQAKSSPVVALSNRMVIALRNPAGKLIETFVIRAQNMHSCIRMGAKLLHDFEKTGPLLNRQVPYKWEKAWDSIVSDYEYPHNPALWGVVYNAGKPVYESGDRHPFLDVIEKYDELNTEKDYDQTILLAEKAFQQTGKNVKIKHETNVAFVINFENNTGRCATLLRGPNKTTTFNFSVTASPDKPLSISQCLNAAAAFLEGVQLAFMVGMNTEKARLGLIEPHSHEKIMIKEGKKRLGRLSREILTLENMLHMRYRPERPEFRKMITEAEQLAAKTLVAPLQDKTGEPDKNENGQNDEIK